MIKNTTFMKGLLFQCMMACGWVVSALAQQLPVLYPTPQTIRYGEGKLPVQNLSVYVPRNAPGEVVFATDELKRVIRERSGKSVKTASSSGTATFRYTIKTPGRELPGTNEADHSREQYALTITTKGVEITAQTSTGLYYAVQTIRQLLQGSGASTSLPVVTIDDQPALAHRGVMMDFAHGGLLTVEEIKQQLDFLARWKTNQYYFYNEVSIQLAGYATLNDNASYSQDQVRSIIGYARQRHIDVIPFVNFYGHLHELIRQEKYAAIGIGRYGHELDPRKPEGKALLKDWIAQYAALFPSPLIHVGFDETWETKRIADNPESTLDPEALYIQQLTFVSGELNKYGKTLLAWTDMNTFYPDILSKFPAGVIPVIWEYSPDSTAINQYLNPILREKRPFYIQPAVSGWGHLYPDAEYTYDNINLCLKAGIRNRTRGFITSVWTDSVEPFVRASWLFMAYGCIGAWQGQVPDKATFPKAYAALVYPSVAGEMAQAFFQLASAGEQLGKCLGKNTQSLPRGTLVESWSNPFSAYYLANTQSHLAEFSQARKSSEEAQGQLMAAMNKASQADTRFIHSLLVSARLVHYSATRFLWARAITDRWNEAMLVRKKADYVIYDLTYPCHSLLVDAMDEAGELKELYAKAWLSENKPYRLNTILGRFDVDYGLWRKLQLKLLDYQIQQQKREPVQSFEELFKPDF